MPDPFLREIQRDSEADTLRRAFLARLDVATMSGKKLVEEYRDKCAASLLEAGITLIPSDHLLDHQFVVSRGVYEAAKRMCEHRGSA